MSDFVGIVPYLETLFMIGRDIKGNPVPIKLQPHQKRILSFMFTPDEKGRLPFRTMLYSTCKKSGKSTIAAAVASWFAFSGIAEDDDEIYLVANDYEQARSRSYKTLRRSIEMCPALRKQVKSLNLANIDLKRGIQIIPISTDYASAAGCNPGLILFDELWGFGSEGLHRLWDELTPVPTRRNSFRFISTYAGIEGESELLWSLYRRIVREGKRVMPDLPVFIAGDSVAYWDEGEESHRMPWQTGEEGERYYREQRESLRPSAYARLHENRWVTSEEGLDMGHWDSCVDYGRQLFGGNPYVPPYADRNIMLAVGVDASYRRDRTAVMTTYRKDGVYYLGPCKQWTPQGGQTLDLEATVESFIRELSCRFRLGPILYDPYQMVRSANTLRALGFQMVEYRQTEPNQRAMAKVLMDLLRYRKLVLPDDPDLRKEALMVSLKETGQGPRIVKDVRSKYIDSIVALSMSLLGAQMMPEYGSFREQIMII